MNGKSVFLNAVRRMPESIEEALEHNRRTLDEVDVFLFHQANLRINGAVASGSVPRARQIAGPATTTASQPAARSTGSGGAASSKASRRGPDH